MPNTFTGKWSGCKTFTPVSGRPCEIVIKPRCCDCNVRPTHRRGKRCIACASDAFSHRRTVVAIKLEGEEMYRKLTRNGVSEAVAWKMAYGEGY